MMQESKKLLLLGSGGHCKSVLDSVIALLEYESIGIIDKNIGEHLMGIPIIGNDEDLAQLFLSGYTHAFIAVGSIGDVSVRKRLYQTIKKIGFHIPNIIDPTSGVSKHAILGEGIYIGKQSVVNAESNIGNGAIVNSSCVIEHDCVIGDFVHVAPGSILCGQVVVNNDTHIGAGSIIKQGVHIGSNTMIGMGSVVLNDISTNVTAYGNPCKEVKCE